MRDLIDFLIKYSKWFIFTSYVIISCMLLFNNNPYQHYIYLTSANTLTAQATKLTSSVSAYFHLHAINDSLHRRNAALQAEVIRLQQQIRHYDDAATTRQLAADSATAHFDYLLAHVISNSISHTNNYITIDRGSIDSVNTEMGIVDQNGVVGIINIVGPHASRVISLLNPKMRLSCKVKGGGHFGSLVWDGKSPREALLEEMPRHIKFNPGDTIVTSGHSAVFPEGIPVGTIISQEKQHNDNFYALRIKLFTDFSTLSTVRIIRNNMKDEIKALEAGEENEQ